MDADKWEYIEIDSAVAKKLYNAINQGFQPIDSKQKYACVLDALSTIIAEVLYNCSADTRGGAEQFSVFFKHTMQLLKGMYEEGEVTLQ